MLIFDVGVRKAVKRWLITLNKSTFHRMDDVDFFDSGIIEF
ncbi:hypothetical protein OH492_27530 [Vibrio chagasii]|nr:hypothetical protein [Vibrio chagasii]